VRSTGPEETRRLGVVLGRLVQAGDVLLLQGELGAGKTTLTQGIAVGTGTDELVNSPTFVLMNEYQGRIPVFHADLYRLEGAEEAAALELSNASLEGVLVVEWPERGEDALPAEHLLVRLEHESENARSITLIPHGARAEALLRAVTASMATDRRDA